MAEHEDFSFEHEFAEKLKAFDENIKIPEIPDAQSIFDKAEKPETKVIPFKKYSRYAAAAAAVVLIAVGLPIMEGALSGEIGLDNIASQEFAVEEPMACPDAETFADQVNDRSDTVAEVEEDPDGFREENNEPVAEYYPSYASSSVSEDEKVYEPQDGVSLKAVLYKYFVNNSVNNPVTGGDGYDDLRTIEEELNKKRKIEITAEEDSVSVVLYDTSSGDEIINALWVEGHYEGSYFDGKYYVINLYNPVSQEDIENDCYLPMAGDANGVYTIPEKTVLIPEKITEGAIYLFVEVDAATGEYNIYANLV